MAHLVDFRTLQAIGDLKAVIAETMPGALGAMDLNAETRAALNDLSNGSDASIAPTLTLLPEAMTIGGDLGRSDTEFAFANAVVLLSILTSGEVPPHALDITLDRAARIRALPVPARGAVANGLCCLVQSGVAQASRFPTPEDRISVDLEATCTALISLAQAVTEQELVHIAKADYHNDREAHYAALKRVIFAQDCIFTDDQSWVPSEVVELISHVPTEPGFVVATAILLTHCLRRGDLQGHTDFRWQNNAAAYLALPAKHRDPLLAGFRYIYESDPDWQPHFSALFDPADHRAVLIPPAAPELTQK